MNHPPAAPANLLEQVKQLLREMNTPAYLVGGAVRDQLLDIHQKSPQRHAKFGRACYDLDFAVPGDGLHVARQLADALGAAFYPLDVKRRVGRIMLPGDGDGTYPARGRIIDVARFQGPDLMADLAGRDFTVNAIALDLTCDPPVLIDPHDGQTDLRSRQLRAVSDQAFINDPVRGLRAVRLRADLGFEIEPRTQALIQVAAPGLASISAERLRDELGKILSLPATTDSLRWLDRLNLLVEILPEVTALKALEQTGHHHWDAYEHTLQSVAALETLLPLHNAPPHLDVPFPDQVTTHLAATIKGGQSRRSMVTLAALLHDVGKRDTATVETNGRVRFIRHEQVGAAITARIMRRFRFSGEAVHLVETIVRHHLRPLQLAWQGVTSKRAIHRFFRDTEKAGIEIALLALADHLATIGPDGDSDQTPSVLGTITLLLDAYFNRQQTVVAPVPLLTGRDLIRRFGVAEGPEVGRLLAALQEAQSAEQVKNREQAEAWMRQKISRQRPEIEF